MAEELKAEPCPFCNSREVYVVTGAQLQYVSCDGCWAEGPAVAGFEEAITAWNTRNTKEVS